MRCKNSYQLSVIGYQSEEVKRTGFTLVELLVVISIIALLLAILMPALIKTRDNAKRIICSKRLSQISLAMSAYAVDCQDKIVMAHDPNCASTPALKAKLRLQLWHILLLPYVGKQVSADPGKNLSEVFFCPQDKDPHPIGCNKAPHAGMTSFAPNGCYQAATATSGEIKLGAAGGYKFSQIRQPSACMLIAETSYAGRIYDGKCKATAALDLYSIDKLAGHHRMTSGFYHNNSMNVMFVDGHIDHIKGIACPPAGEEFTPPDYAAGKYMFWPELTLPDADSKPEFWGPGY
jgi:prepilin-type N-terminal cleavage/methylation domain-containing protein/prepilin-type processing-associated H-X9-DG protein